MDRRIAEQAELREGLQIHRVELRRLLNEALLGRERRSSKRCAVEDGQQKILRDEVSRSIALLGAVSDRAAAKVTVGALNQVALADGQRQGQGDRVIQLRAVAALHRGYGPGLDLACDAVAGQRFRLRVAL